MHGTRRFRTRQTRETRAALQGGHDAVPQRRSYGLSTPLPAVASPRVFVPEVVYCGGGTTTTTFTIGGGEAHEVETRR